MIKLDTHKRYLAVGLVGALFLALGAVVGLWALSQSASAQRAVVLIHVNVDGTDYVGNPDCPEGGQMRDALGNTVTDITKSVRAIDDCNNLIGTQHLIRTDGFDATMVADATAWRITGPGFLVAPATGAAVLCSDPMFASFKGPNWDVPAGAAAVKNLQYCLVIGSNDWGETQIEFNYTFTPPTSTATPTPTPTASPSPTPTPPGVGHNTARVVKEWNKIEHTEIWKLTCTSQADPTSCSPSLLVGAGDLTGPTVVETSRVPIVFDTALDRLRGLQLLGWREIVFGQHPDADPDAQGNHPLTVPVPIEGAQVRAFIDNDNDNQPDTFGTQTCAFFTTFSTIGVPPDLGTLLTGVTQLSLRDIYVDTTCKEITTIKIEVRYPEGLFSNPPVFREMTKILWTEQEAGKQPQIRWAGEKIVLAKRWALPGDFYPNALVVAPQPTPTPPATATPTPPAGLGQVCPHAGQIVQYNREDGPGGLANGLPDVGGPLSNGPDKVVTIVDAQCNSRALYESELQGQVDVKVLLLDPVEIEDGGSLLADHQDALNACIAFFNSSSKLAADQVTLNACLAGVDESYRQDLAAGLADGSIIARPEGKQDAFLVWYIKIFQVKQENVLLKDGVGLSQHNAGTWGGEDPVTGAVATAETLNVSQDAMQRVTVKGYFYGGDPSGRGAACVDMNGNGNGKTGTDATAAGEPYPIPSYEAGCTDPGDELLHDGYWVLPDDMPTLAGPSWYVDKANWDVMSEGSPTNTAAIGYMSTLDSIDTVIRPWVPAFNTNAGFNTTRKTVDPDGKLTAADAIMPPLKLTAMINDPKDAGFLDPVPWTKGAGAGLYQSVMIPADPEIPQIGESGGGTYGYELNSWVQGPYQFFRIFLSALGLAKDCNDVYSDSTVAEGKLCNANIGNQGDQKAQDENHPRVIQFYSDNRGLGFFFANGDFNLSFNDCPPDEVTGTPVCSPKDVVGTSKIQVQGAYPYYRAYSGVDSNIVTKTWEWGGFKNVTAVSLDVNHTAIIAHLKDRDGFCKFSVTPGTPTSVVFSPSDHPVEGEEIVFQVVSGGQIRVTGVNEQNEPTGAISPNALFGSPPSPAPLAPLSPAKVTGWADGVLINETQAVALAEDVRVLGAHDPSMARSTSEDDECQAWIVVEHDAGVVPNVSVIFNDPEGNITRHYPPKDRIVRLVNGWNDACYSGREMPIEDAMAPIIDDVVAVYRLVNGEGTWDRWFPGRADISTITTVKPYDQLIILMNANVDWTVEISNPPTSVDLVKDWDSVCYAGNPKAPGDATASIAGDFTIMYTLASDQSWRRFVPGREDLNTIGETLNQFTSLFIMVTADTTWVFDP